jgi:hypothetical protein
VCAVRYGYCKQDASREDRAEKSRACQITSLLLKGLGGVAAGVSSVMDMSSPEPTLDGTWVRVRVKVRVKVRVSGLGLGLGKDKG